MDQLNKFLRTGQVQRIAPPNDRSDSIQLLHYDWSTRLTNDIEDAKLSVTLSALSMLPSSARASGTWALCWRALVNASNRTRAVKIYLPAPMRASAATSRNFEAAKMLHSAGITCTLVPGPRLLHAKSAIIDRKIVYIGSGNFTEAAASHNHETYLRIEHPAIAARHQQYLDQLANS